jgi:phosphoribosylamine--glycine ligase
VCNVLLIGGGGREHALAWKMRQSPRLGELWLSDGAGPPANAGLSVLGRPCPVAMDARDVFRMTRWCDAMTFIWSSSAGSRWQRESPTRCNRLSGWSGPTKAAAQIEADKSFAKQLMRTHRFRRGRAFTSTELARVLCGRRTRA